MNTLIVCTGLFFIGLALHLSRAFWLGDERVQSRESSMADALRLLAFQTQLAAVILMMYFMMGPFALIAAAIIILALGEAMWRHSVQERRTLAWVFASAAEHRIPIAEALTAFYSADDVKRSSKGVRLISLLSLGMPLHLALQGAGIRLTPSLRLAVAQGVTLGALPERMARAISEEETLEEDLQRLNHKIGYSATVLFTMCVTLYLAAAIMIFIIPTIEKMAEEFETKLPAITQLSIALSQGAVHYGVATLCFLAALTLAPILAIMVGMHQFGFYLWDYPIVVRFFSAFDRARLYRALAVSIRRNESMLPVFDQLGVFFPRAYIRIRLIRARNRLVRGEPWLAALSAEGLIPSTDRRILESAQRHGNIPWSLEELATIRAQRQVQRIESLVTIINVLLVLLLGLFTFLYGSAVYLTVAKLAGDLA
jgi:type II secretory pathway component PulF